jgi:hypothetical protein
MTWKNFGQTNKKDLFIARCDELQEKGSGWVFQRVNCIRININKYTPLRAISYIELPKWIKNKKACINIKTGTINVLCGLFNQHYILLKEIQKEFQNTDNTNMK